MNDMLTVEEVVTRLRVGRTTLYRWVEEGKIKPYKAGGRRTYFKREDVDKLFQPIEENEPDLIPDPSVEELEEAALAFQEAAAERAASILSTSTDIRRIAADVLAARRAGLERASA